MPTKKSAIFYFDFFFMFLSPFYGFNVPIGTTYLKVKVSISQVSSVFMVMELLVFIFTMAPTDMEESLYCEGDIREDFKKKQL